MTLKWQAEERDCDLGKKKKKEEAQLPAEESSKSIGVDSLCYQEESCM
jgi:hypothetical protein